MSVRKRSWEAAFSAPARVHKKFTKKILQPIDVSAIYAINQTRHASDEASASHCAPRRVLSFPAVDWPT